MKKILIIQGHPNKESLVAALSQHYFEGAMRKGHDVELIHLCDLDFDLVLHAGYKGEQKLEPDLVMMQKKIENSEHIVIAFPMWWGSMPALLKGFIDRTFLPGWAFEYTGKLPKKLLIDKSARFIMTMDSPAWYYKLFIGAPGIKIIKKSVLKFCGFSPIKSTVFSNVRGSDKEKREKWFKKMSIFGVNGN